MDLKEFQTYSKNFSFQLNSSYEFKNGTYIVKQIKCSSIIFLNSDAKLQEINLCLAKRMHLNFLFESQNFQKSVLHIKCQDEPLYDKTKFSDEDFFWTLGSLTTSILRAEVGSDYKEEFQERLCISEEEFHVNTNIYFDSKRHDRNGRRLFVKKSIFENSHFCLPCEGHVAHSTKTKETFHINNKKIIDFLVKHHNFSFGKNHNLEKIKETVNVKFVKSFMEGVFFALSLDKKK